MITLMGSIWMYFQFNIQLQSNNHQRLIEVLT